MTFDLATVADGTRLAWTHTGSVSGVMGLLLRFYSMEKVIAPDMEKGLASSRPWLRGLRTRTDRIRLCKRPVRSYVAGHGTSGVRDLHRRQRP